MGRETLRVKEKIERDREQDKGIEKECGDIVRRKGRIVEKNQCRWEATGVCFIVKVLGVGVTESGTNGAGSCKKI